MKLNVKKIYCPNCSKLVKAREQQANSNVQLSCPRCGKLIYSWDGASWRYPREE